MKANLLFCSLVTVLVGISIVLPAQSGGKEDTSIVINLREEFINSLVDSINQIEDTKVFPKWIFNPYFDYEYSYKIFDFHQFNSIRKIAIDRVSNINSLHLILHNPERVLDAIVYPGDSILSKYILPMPYSLYSTRKLVELRISELESRQ